MQAEKLIDRVVANGGKVFTTQDGGVFVLCKQPLANQLLELGARGGSPGGAAGYMRHRDATEPEYDLVLHTIKNVEGDLYAAAKAAA